MIRSRVLLLPFHRNNCSKVAITGLANPSPGSNLKRRDFISVLNNIHSKNCKTIREDKSDNIFAIAVDDSSINPHNSRKSSLRNSPNEGKPLGFSYPNNYSITKCNASSTKTSSLLTMKHNYVGNSSIQSLGIRHLSSEATQRIEAPELYGFWKDVSESAPVEFVQDALISFQSTTNLPWWATVVLSTLIVRSTLTLPLSLYQHYILAKVQNLSGEMNDIVKQLKTEANIAVSHHGWTEEYTRTVYERSVSKKWSELVQRENCHPAKGLIVLWTQIPLWLTISSALRNMCYMLPPSHTNAMEIYLQLTTGGFGWVVNLIDTDHYWILPVSVGIFNLANIEIMTLIKIKEDTRLQRIMLFFFRSISIAMVPIATYVPSCICLYWASSSAFGVVQNLLLLSPRMRRLGGVPQTATERANPYRDLVAKFRAKKYFSFRRKTDSLE